MHLVGGDARIVRISAEILKRDLDLRWQIDLEIKIAVIIFHSLRSCNFLMNNPLHRSLGSSLERTCKPEKLFQLAFSTFTHHF